MCKLRKEVQTSRRFRRTTQATQSSEHDFAEGSYPQVVPQPTASNQPDTPGAPRDPSDTDRSAHSFSRKASNQQKRLQNYGYGLHDGASKFKLTQQYIGWLHERLDHGLGTLLKPDEGFHAAVQYELLWMASTAALVIIAMLIVQLVRIVGMKNGDGQ